MTLQEFIQLRVAEATPGRSGWKARRFPYWVKQYAEAKEAKRNAEWEVRNAERVAEAERLKKERFMISLEIGETMSLSGHFNPIRVADVISNSFLGGRYFSHSQSAYADCVYIPADITCTVIRYDRGCPLSFSRIVIKRIK